MDDKSIKKTFPMLVTLAGLASVIVFLFLYGNFITQLVLQHIFDGQSIASIFPAVLNIAELIIGTEIFLIITKFAISKYIAGDKKKHGTKIILKLYSYLVWCIVLIIIASSFFGNIGALLTSLGLIGFGITFALQKPILNFVGWLTIFLTDPFTVGDRIEVSEIRGDVISIHTMHTKIQGTRTNSHEKSEKKIALPNEFILTNPVINYSRMNEIYTDELTVSITFESNWRKAIELLEKATLNAQKKFVKQAVPKTKAEKKAFDEALKLLQEASKKIKKGFVKESVKENIGLMKSAETLVETDTPKPNILMSFGDSSINLNVIYQTDLRSIRSTKHEIAKSFMEEIEKTRDIEFAYPHMQIVSDIKMKGKQKIPANKLLEYLNQQ